MRWVIAVVRRLRACGLIDLVLLIATLSLTACSVTNRRVDMIIPRQCLTKDLKMLDCNRSTDPPSCKRFTIEYIKDCEEIVVRKK